MVDKPFRPRLRKRDAIAWRKVLKNTPKQAYERIQHPDPLIEVLPEIKTISRIASAIEIPKDSKSKDIYFLGCYGFGDCFNQRPIIKHLAEYFRTIYLRTTLPEAYWDIPNIKFVRPEKLNLRTQWNHLNKSTYEFVNPPTDAKVLHWHLFPPSGIMRKDRVSKQLGFGPADTYLEPELSVQEHSKLRAGIKNYDYLFPVRKEWIASARDVVSGLNLKGKKLCIIRPSTERKEWPCLNRNPKSEYIQLLINRYKDEYFFLSIADIKEGEEWFDGELKNLDATFHHGELPISTIFGLIKISDMVITGPAFFMLAAIAIRTKCFTIFGGRQKPEWTISECMGLDNFEYVAPEPTCNCLDVTHNCKKDIPENRIIEQFEKLKARPKRMHEVSIGVPPGIGDTHWIILKMESFKERQAIDCLKFVIWEPYHYTSEFLRLIPFIDKIEKKPKPNQFSFSLAGGTGQPVFKNQQGLDYLMEFGSRLEAGVKLDDVLPEYETNWNYEIKLSSASCDFALGIKQKAGGKLYLAYASSCGANKNWARDDWTPTDWIDLLKRIHEETGCKIVLIGATFDRDYASLLMKEPGAKEMIIDLVGKTSVEETLSLIRSANLMMSFSCGLALLAAHFGVPLVKFWPIKGVSKSGVYRKEFIYSWLPPGFNESGKYMPFIYGEPKTKPATIFKALRRFLLDTPGLSWDAEKEIGYYPVKNPIYDDDYFKRVQKNDHSPIVDALNDFRKFIVNSYVSSNGNGGLVLDFGAGSGIFMRRRGNCQGFDFCEKSKQRLKSDGLFFNPYIENLEKFKAITFFDSFEHIQEPDLILSRIGNQYVFVTLPIFKDKEHILRSKHFKPKEHFWYFTFQGFVRYMNERGFALLSSSDQETKIGREDIMTFVFRRPE